MKQDAFFSPSFGRLPAVLVGREMVLREFEEGLSEPAGSRDRATLIMGQRGTGKTVLLLTLAGIAEQKGFVTASPTVTDAGMLDQIIEKIQFEGSKLYKPKKKIAGGGVGILGISANLSFTPEENEERSFSYKVMRLAEKLEEHGKGILILVDEVQAGHDELRRLVIAYQELVGAGKNVAIAMAGLPGTVSAILNDKVLTFLHRAKKVRLEKLPSGEIDAFFLHAFRELGVQLSDSGREAAVEAAQGSPYHMQLIGHYITKFADNNGRISPAALKSALQKAETEYMDGVCIAVADALTETERRFIAAMKEGEDSAIKDIAEKMRVSADMANNYRRRLLDAGIIESPRRGVVRCTVPYLVAYLEREYAES